MHIIIPAAGYATRLHPLTIDQPKALLEVGGKTILDHLLDNIDSLPEVYSVTVVSNNKFFPHFSDWSDSQAHRDYDVVVLNDGTMSNEDRLGAVGDMLVAIDHLDIGDADILVMACDNMLPDRFADMVAAWRTQESGGLLPYLDVQDLDIASRMGVLDIDESGKIKAIIEKPENPPSTLASSMIYGIPNSAIGHIRDAYEDPRFEGEVGGGHLIEYLLEHEDFYGYELSAWHDVGNHEQLAKAREIYGSDAAAE